MAVRVAPGPASTPRSRVHAASTRARADGELTRFRSQAEQWRNGLTGMLTLFVTAGLFKGDSTVTELTAWPRVIAGASVLLSIAIAALGLYLSMRAAFGLPHRRLSPGTPDEVLAAESRMISRAVRQLHVAIAAALVSLGLILLALGVVWYSPAA